MSRTHSTLISLLVVFSLTMVGCRSILPGQPPTPTSTPLLIPTFAPPTPTSTLTPTPAPSSTPVPPPTLTPTTTLYVLPGTPLPALLPVITDLNASQVSALSEWRVSEIADLAWTPDSSLLAIATDIRIEMYDPLTRENLRTLYPQTEGLVNIEFGPGYPGSWLLAGSRRGSEAEGWASAFELWRGPDWQPFGILLGVTRGLIDMAYSPDGTRVATAYGSPVERDNLVEFLDPISWTASAEIKPGLVQDIAFSPDGKFFAVTPDRYTIKIWDLERAQLAYKFFTTFTGSANSMLFSPDGNLLAIGTYDGVIKLYDVASGVLIREIPVGAVIESLSFSPDSRLLASGSGFQENTIHLWSVTTGELLRTLDRFPQSVTALLFSPDGRLLVSGSFGGLVRLWGIRPE